MNRQVNSLAAFILALVPVVCPCDSTVHKVSQQELHDLKGKTYDEVVDLLGCPSRIREGTGGLYEKFRYKADTLKNEDYKYCNWAVVEIDTQIQPKRPTNVLFLRDESGEFRVVQVVTVTIQPE